MIRPSTTPSAKSTTTAAITPLRSKTSLPVLLKHGADPTARTDDVCVVGGIYDSGGRTPLHLAAAKGHAEVLEHLLGHGIQAWLQIRRPDKRKPRQLGDAHREELEEKQDEVRIWHAGAGVGNVWSLAMVKAAGRWAEKQTHDCLTMSIW